MGRARETAALAAFLADSGVGGLVLTGEAGRGKTALWEHAAALGAASGATVLRAGPGEGEERYSFAVLQDLLRPVDLDEHDLPGPVREALDAALLRAAADGAVDAHAVNVGVHAVLTALAARGPVLVCVDDAQWADPGSLEALAAAARRLGEAPVRFLLTRRSGFERTALEAVLVRGALQVVEPAPLSREETARLLHQELGLTPTRRLLDQLWDQTHGNPLSVLEVGRVLRERGLPAPGEPLDVPGEVATVLGLRVRDLPEPERRVLLAVALDPHLSEADLVAFAGLEAVDAAVRGQVVTVSADGRRVRPWHPVLAAAAREAATPTRRREVLTRLAEVVGPPERRLRHRALVSPDGDEGLAEELSAAARAAGRRGAAATALELSELALARTPDGSARRTERLLDLAGRLAEASEAQRLTDLLAPEVDALPEGPERGRALLLLLDGVWGSIGRAEELVERALVESGGDLEVRQHALEMRSVLATGIRVSGLEPATAWAEEAMALGGAPIGEGHLFTGAVNWCRVHRGLPPRPEAGPPYWKRLIWRGQLVEAEALVRAAVAAAEEGGRYQEWTMLHVSTADVLVRGGRVAEARELVAVQEDLDLSARESPDLELLRAEVEVRYGDEAAARALGRLARDRAEELGHTWIRLEADRALATADLQGGDPAAAAERLRGVHAHVLAAGVREPGMFPVAPELAEAWLLSGGSAEAEAVLGWLEEVAAEQDHPWARAHAARLRALRGLLDRALPPTEAATRTDAVAGDLVALGLSHDAARAHLVLGSALRRRRQWGLARDHLDRALALFDGLGADGWAATARGELDRVGGRRPGAAGALSATETETARLAAAGLANKSIARRLGISVSTVEAHLSRAYAKLGVRSRTQLAARLEPSEEG